MSTQPDMTEAEFLAALEAHGMTPVNRETMVQDLWERMPPEANPTNMPCPWTGDAAKELLDQMPMQDLTGYVDVGLPGGVRTMVCHLNAGPNRREKLAYLLAARDRAKRHSEIARIESDAKLSIMTALVRASS